MIGQPFDKTAPHVLIVRTSALGDIVQGLPVLEALKQLRPEARVGWVVESRFAELLEGHPAIDVLISIRSREWRQRLLDPETRRQISATRQALRAFDADIALDLMSNFKAASLAWLSGARRRVGLASPHRREPASGWMINHSVEPFGIHAVDRALSVLRPFGLRDPVAPHGGEALVGTELDGDSMDLPSAFAILHPGAGWRNKELPPAVWGRVCELFGEQTGIAVLIVTGPGEEQLGEATAAASRGAGKHLHLPGLQPLVALQRRATLVLGGDTGPLHLANALNRPLVCVMGPTDPARHGPWLRPEGVISQRLPCSYCHKRLDSARGCLVGLSPVSIAKKAAEIASHGKFSDFH
jgi:lipopolysaccharide heptosyltransferase I